MADKRGAAERRAKEEWYRKAFKRRRKGESVRALAERIGVNHHTLAYWSLELRRRDARVAKKRKRSPALVPVQLPEVRLGGAFGEGYEVRLCNDRVLHVPARFDASSLKTLIDVLEA